MDAPLHRLPIQLRIMIETPLLAGLLHLDRDAVLLRPAILPNARDLPADFQAGLSPGNGELVLGDLTGDIDRSIATQAGQLVATIGVERSEPLGQAHDGLATLIEHDDAIVDVLHLGRLDKGMVQFLVLWVQRVIDQEAAPAFGDAPGYLKVPHHLGRSVGEEGCPFGIRGIDANAGAAAPPDTRAGVTYPVDTRASAVADSFYARAALTDPFHAGKRAIADPFYADADGTGPLHPGAIDAAPNDADSRAAGAVHAVASTALPIHCGAAATRPGDADAIVIDAKDGGITLTCTRIHSVAAIGGGNDCNWWIAPSGEKMGRQTILKRNEPQSPTTDA